MFWLFCIWEIPLCQVMNITLSGTRKLVLLLESDDQRLRKQHIKMFPCVNMHQCHQWKKNLPDALALTDNELCKEMVLNWKCEHLQKKTFRKTFFFLETPTLFELEEIKLNM